jgi:phage/plasmid-associated DNA primase
MRYQNLKKQKSINRFFKNKLVPKANARLIKSEVYAAYVEYCDKKGLEVFTNQGFWQKSYDRLKELNVTFVTKRVEGFKPIAYVRGIDFK